MNHSTLGHRTDLIFKLSVKKCGKPVSPQLYRVCETFKKEAQAEKNVGPLGTKPPGLEILRIDLHIWC